MNILKRIFQAGLLLLAVTATASAQVAVPFSDGGYHYAGPQAAAYGGAYSGTGSAQVPWLGRTMFSLNGAVEGLGFEGSYFSAATTVPLGNDSLYGWWLLDMRASLSQQGRPFTNIGIVRRTHFSPLSADFGLGLFYDMDADEYERFGHTFHQVGVSAHMWTPYFDVNVNGYIPVGASNRAVGTPDTCFFQNYLLLQNGIDSALEGFEVDFGIRPPAWQQQNGTLNLGVYSYSSESVDAFAGFQGSYSWQPKPGMRLVVGMTSDDTFDPTGLFQLELWRGRSRGYTPSGRDLDPIRRNSHIVRFHQDPVFLTDPDTLERIRVVHVDNSVAEGGDGTFENPYNELADADGTLPAYVDRDMLVDIPRSLPGDIIFVHEGLSRIDRGLFLTPDDPTDDTPFDPTDDLPFDLTGYDTGITLLAGQQLLGDGVLHVIETVEDGNFPLCNNIDGFTPFISNPDGAAVTLADDTTVRGFEIVNSKTGILAPDPTPLANNSDGITGDVVIEDVNILINDPVFRATDFNPQDGDDINPDLATFRIPLEIGIDIQDSTANFFIDDVDIVARDVLLPDQIISDTIDDAMDRTIQPILEGDIIAAINIERGAPDLFFNGLIDNTFTVFEQQLADDMDPMTDDPILELALGELQVGGAAVRVLDTTGGDRVYDGMIMNIFGEGIAIKNNSDGSDIFDATVLIEDPDDVGILLADNMNQIITFTHVDISTPANDAALAAVLAAGAPIPPLNTVLGTPVAGFVAERNDGGLITAAGEIDITGGPAVIVSTPDPFNTPINMVFTDVDSTASLDGGVVLANASGTFHSSRTEVLDSAGTAITVTGADTDALTAKFGQVLISATVDAMGDPLLAQGPGVVIQDSDMANISFTTLNITTTAGLGFQAINGGTVDFTTAPIINATGGAAVDIENTIGLTNGLAGFTFESLTSIDSADEGVRLVNMVSDFTVRGDTFIQDNAGFGIEVAGVGVAVPGPDAVVIDFNEVNIVSRDNVGVQISDITGVVKFASLDIDSDIIDDMGDATPPNGFTDRPAGNGVNILNTFANDGRVEINGGIIRDVTNDGIYIENSIATVQNVTITTSDLDDVMDPDFDSLDMDDGIQVVTSGTGSSIVLLQNNVIDHPVDDTNATPTEADLFGDNGVRLISNGVGTLNATILNNVVDSNDILAFPADSIGSLHATVESGTMLINVIGQNNGNGEAPTEPFFLENLGGTFNVTQTSLGNLSTLNNNVNVVTGGVINFGAGNPPLPPPIMP